MLFLTVVSKSINSSGHTATVKIGFCVFVGG